MNTDAKSEMNLELIDFLNSNEFKVDNLPICVYLSILRLLIEKVEGDADSLPHVRVPTKKLGILLSLMAPSQLKNFRHEKIWCILNQEWVKERSAKITHTMEIGAHPQLSPLRTFVYRGNPLDMRFRNSRAWTRQQSFYKRLGAKAWTKGTVPSQISTNCFVRDYYFDILASYLADDIKRQAQYSQGKALNVAVIELAAGHGALSIMMARAHYVRQRDLHDRIYRRLIQEHNLDDTAEEILLNLDLKICFIATDFHAGVFQSLLVLEYVQELCRKGLLAFSIAKAEAESSYGAGNGSKDCHYDKLLDLEGNDILDEKAIVSCVVMANYAFDSFPSSLFMKSEGGNYYGLGVIRRRIGAIQAQRRTSRKEKRRRKRDRKKRCEPQWEYR